MAGKGDHGAGDGGGVGGRAELQEAQEPVFTWADMNARQKAKHVLANVTVEPVILIFAVLSTLAGTASFWLNIGRACSLHLNATGDACDLLYQGVTDERTAAYILPSLTIVTEMQVWQTPLRNSVPVLLVLFVGSWADKRHRRKPFLIAPIVGDLLTCIGLLLAYYFAAWPLELVMGVEAVFPALTGALPILLMSVFSYISDVTTAENRTYRIGMVATSFSWGLPIAVAASGPLFDAVGFAPVYILCIALYAPALAYAVTCIREPRPPVPRPEGVSFLADFFDWKNVWTTVKVALRRRRGSRQLQIFLVMVLYVCVQGPVHGEGSVMSAYQVAAFNWNATDQSLYATYFILVLAAGNVVVTTVFSKWLKMNDCTIGMIAMAARVVVAPLLAWASTTWQFYAVTALDVLTSGGAIALRAVASKLVEFDELGKLMALFAVVEAIIPVFFAPIYSKVYSSTNAIAMEEVSDDVTTAASALANATTTAATTVASAVTSASTAAAAILADASTAAASVLADASTAAATVVDDVTAAALLDVDATVATTVLTDITTDAALDVAGAAAATLDIANATVSGAANATVADIASTAASDIADGMAMTAHVSAAFLYISCAVSICGFILFVVIRELQRSQARREERDLELDTKKGTFEGGVTNAGFQGDQHGHVRARTHNGGAAENTNL